MNRILYFFLFFIFISKINYAQYTTIINANRPGNTETAYAVGLGVLQIENTTSHERLKTPKGINTTSAIGNDILIQYGFLSERFQASINNRSSYGRNLNNNDKVNGTERFSIGVKYLIYEHINKERKELKESWKKRYGFKYNGLFPSIAVAVKYNTPIANESFNNEAQNSLVLSIITQNNINRKLRLNSQFNYNNFKKNFTNISYALSASYVLAQRWNPYIQMQFHKFKHDQYFSLGTGIPFLVNRNFMISGHYNIPFGYHTSGHQFGIDLAYRIDHHRDNWQYLKKTSTEKKSVKTGLVKKEEFINSILEKSEREVEVEVEVEDENQITKEIVEDKKERKKKEKERKRKEKERKRKEKEERKKREKEEKKKSKAESLENLILSF